MAFAKVSEEESMIPTSMVYVIQLCSMVIGAGGNPPLFAKRKQWIRGGFLATPSHAWKPDYLRPYMYMYTLYHMYTVWAICNAVPLSVLL